MIHAENYYLTGILWVTKQYKLIKYGKMKKIMQHLVTIVDDFSIFATIIVNYWPNNNNVCVKKMLFGSKYIAF